MKIGIDISPLKSGHHIQHRVRGVGFYLENLKNSLLKYCPENSYIFFEKKEKLPEDIDLIHFPYFEPFFLTLPIVKRKKTVVTVHDLTPLVFPGFFPAGIKGKIKWNIQKILLKQANRIITDSISSKNDIVRFVGYPEEKIDVVYLAAGEQFKKLEIGNWKLEIEKKYGLPNSFLLYVGDVTWNKNLPRLIKAAIKADIQLVMVGKALTEEDFDKNNSWNQDLAEVQKLAENKNIIRLGFVPTEDLIALYNMATVFVMPSIYEGFGLPILEAMSCGCPVVTSKEGSIPEVAGDAAFYVDAYSEEDIAKGIKKVFKDNKFREDLSEKGIRHAKRFSWEKTAAHTMEVYEKLKTYPPRGLYPKGTCFVEAVANK